jgi:hypothetical protein
MNHLVGPNLIRDPAKLEDKETSDMNKGAQKYSIKRDKYKRCAMIHCKKKNRKRFLIPYMNYKRISNKRARKRGTGHILVSSTITPTHGVILQQLKREKKPYQYRAFTQFTNPNKAKRFPDFGRSSSCYRSY